MPPIERILQVHTRYRQAGGEDQVVAAEERLLREAGIEVRQVIFDNADLQESRSILGDVGLAASSIWSLAAKARIAAEIRDFGPQVMHVHNTFAVASPSIYAAAASAGVAVVQTLHNYRLVCPSATAFRDGHACTDCVGRLIPWPGVAHRCVRGSLAQSATVAAMLVTHRALRTWRRRIGQYIALTEFQRQLLVSGGLPRGKIRIIPNFLEPDPRTGTAERSGLLFVGRLAVEKGIGPLLDAAGRLPGTVRVAGAGPLEGPVAAAAASATIEYLGLLDGEAVSTRMQAAVAVVVPSINFEGFPVTLLEAFATGTPVIASRIGSLAELVEDGVTGLLAEPGNGQSLAERMRWAMEHPEEMREMGDRARARYESVYRGAAHLHALLEAYEAATEPSPRRPDRSPA